MLTSIQGVYRKGKIDIGKVSLEMPDETPVIVTFLELNTIDLRQLGIDEQLAADLRARLATFEDWNDREMDVYDLMILNPNRTSNEYLAH
jgi:hypothetical protein